MAPASVNEVSSLIAGLCELSGTRAIDRKEGVASSTPTACRRMPFPSEGGLMQDGRYRFTGLLHRLHSGFTCAAHTGFRQRFGAGRGRGKKEMAQGNASMPIPLSLFKWPLAKTGVYEIGMMQRRATARAQLG